MNESVKLGLDQSLPLSFTFPLSFRSCQPYKSCRLPTYNILLMGGAANPLIAKPLDKISSAKTVF